jgi:hypothetical protein
MAEERDEFLSKTTRKVRKRRKDGWTRRDIETFLQHLRITGNVCASAQAAGKSAKAAYNLRDIDAAFAAQMEAAHDERDARLESKIALFAETSGRLPPLREDGEPAEAPLEDFDPHLALAYLSYRRAKREGHGRKGRPQPRVATHEEVVQAVATLVGMVKRRPARRAG